MWVQVGRFNLAHLCVVLDNGEAKCWGKNKDGYSGTPSLADDTPLAAGTDIPAIDLGSGRTAQHVAAGEFVACALLDNGGVKCWGNSNYGQMGYAYRVRGAGKSENTMGDYLPLVDLGTDRTAKKLIHSLNSFCAILDDNSVKCWGRNMGTLGQDNSNTFINDPSTVDPINLGESRTALDIASGQHLMCAILDDGTVRCWGSGTDGGLGSGDTVGRGTESSKPLLSAPLVDLGTGRTAKIAVGLYFGCALLDNDSVKCWGRNTDGQLGQGDTENRGDEPDELGDKLPPVDVGTGKTVKQIVAMFDGCCALLNDDTVKCWGDWHGQEHSGKVGDEPGEMGDSLPAVKFGTKPTTTTTASLTATSTTSSTNTATWTSTTSLSSSSTSSTRTGTSSSTSSSFTTSSTKSGTDTSTSTTSSASSSSTSSSHTRTTSTTSSASTSTTSSTSTSASSSSSVSTSTSTTSVTSTSSSSSSSVSTSTSTTSVTSTSSSSSSSSSTSTSTTSSTSTSGSSTSSSSTTETSSSSSTTASSVTTSSSVTSTSGTSSSTSSTSRTSSSTSSVSLTGSSTSSTSTTSSSSTSTSSTSSTSTTSSASSSTTGSGTSTTLSQSSTTRTPGTPAEAARQRQEEQRKEQAAAAAEAVDAAEQESVQQLLSILDFASPANSTETGGVLGQVSMSTETGTLKVAALSPEAVEAAGGSVAVSAGETGAKVEMPAAILSQAAELFEKTGVSGPVLLSLTSMSDETAKNFADQQVEGELAATLQSEPLSINLRGPDGSNLKIGELQTPMEIVLKVKNPNATCSYWDEDESRWSSKGLTTLSSTAAQLTCLTTHLSIFAGVLQIIVERAAAVISCSSAWALMSEKGFQKLMGRRKWMGSLPSVSTFVFIALFLAIQSRAAYMDRRDKQMVPWEELEPVLFREASPSDEELPRRRVRPAWACCRYGLVQLKEWCCWCTGICFGVENILQLITEAIPNAPEASVNRCIRSLHAHRCGVALDSLEILLTNEKFEVEESVPRQVSHTQARRSRFSRLMQSVVQNVNQFATAVRDLSARWEVHLHGASAVESILQRGWCSRICLLVPAFHPWIALLRFSILTPYTVRVALVFLKLCTAGATNALFFTSTTPSPDDDPGCRQKLSFFEALVQNCIVGFLSAFLGDCIIFTLFLVQVRSPAEKKQWTEAAKAWKLAWWRCRSYVFWLLWLVYTITCLAYIMMFLANAQLEDAHKWYQSTGMSLLQDMVLLPLGMALALGTIATCALRSQGIRKRIKNKWYLQPEDGEQKEPESEPEGQQRGRRHSSASSGSDQAGHSVLEVDGKASVRGLEISNDFRAVLPGMPD